MSFSRPTLATIYGRMKADLESRLKQSGWVDEINWVAESLILISLAVDAGAIHQAYGFLTNLSRELFFTTASDEFLPWHAQLWNRPQKPATEAVGEVRFVGTESTEIPAGTEVQTEDGTIFVTDTTETIVSGYANVDITAAQSGTAGNVEAESMTLVTPIAGISSDVTVLEQPNGGTDRETRDALVARLLQRTRNPPGSGNKGDYERWALSIPGVGRAWIRAAAEWQGAGTVGVIIASDALEIVDAAVRTNVIDYIESIRPVGAKVTVADPDPINCGFDIDITPNTSTIRSEINAKLREVFVVDANPGGTMLLSHIRKAIATTAVNDFEITQIRRGGTPIGVVNITSTLLELLRFDESDTTYSELT